MAHKSSRPQLIFGASGFGQNFPNAPEVHSVLDLLAARGIKILDTAGRYPLSDPGKSEKLIGETRAVERGFLVDTKITALSHDHRGDLTREDILKSVDASLERLKVTQINTLHIHWPDPQTPVEEQAGALDELYKQGKFKYLGISNFLASSLAEFLRVCDEKNYVKPCVYQGDYSLVNRGAEKHLFPLLRRHGIAFNAFRVIASGFLSGNLTTGSTDGTRFGGGDATANYMVELYDHDSLHKAQRTLAGAIREVGISTVEAALRWVAYHSALGVGDGIILGASRESQIISNLDALEKGPLPASVVEAIEDIWNDLKAEREGKYIF